MKLRHVIIRFIFLMALASLLILALRYHNHIEDKLDTPLGWFLAIGLAFSWLLAFIFTTSMYMGREEET